MNIDKNVKFLKVLGETSRLEILYYLKNTKKNAREIQEKINKSQSRVSQHLKKLIDENLVDSEIIDNANYYYIKNNKIFNILNLIEEFIAPMNESKIEQIQQESFIDILGG